MTIAELWQYKEAMISCAQFYKDQDHELSLLFKEEAKWASGKVWSEVNLKINEAIK